ncbi:MAG: exodeoxyribonuclease VII small subunit [Alphaproteobacteria bacterium]|nr:exodeoxyribonuclease VII small subunit [Alphaproteobacteria bacterium]
MSEPNQKPAISEMSFETALRELEEIVTGLENGDIPLEISIASYERGTELKKHCESKLSEARLRVEKISLSPDGTIEAKDSSLD